ncbi:hypothetical protein F8388_005359 [Cannabis sativa]|uniref:Uncharacterized protein n=1 Tax=Cannabis sativa TaxID=3483 RepID=A0A7J6FZ03_CANSA|nr:hypothetical protein F8388_005359 [Cannabis sativa]KAF4374949.1 hypothetical protein G4B88_004700 [Cannabis sativa]
MEWNGRHITLYLALSNSTELNTIVGEGSGFGSKVRVRGPVQAWSRGLRPASRAESGAGAIYGSRVRGWGWGWGLGPVPRLALGQGWDIGDWQWQTHPPNLDNDILPL